MRRLGFVLAILLASSAVAPIAPADRDPLQR
jgi:hypothetical protein